MQPAFFRGIRKDNFGKKREYMRSIFEKNETRKGIVEEYIFSYNFFININEEGGAMKKIMTLFLAVSLMLTNAMGVKAGVLTPYETEKDSAEFVNGATFVLEQRNDYEEWLNRELSRAKDTYHINTITVYGLEQYDDAYKTCLFETLKKLDMKICVRIEAYDGETFAFTKEDAADVIRRHEKLVEFTCLPENRDVVFYYAINMPVDDGKVQEHLGGVNSRQCKDGQVSYAEEIVRQMRELTKAGGYEDAKLYLSVFFGWDAAYEIPSYASANADGYFINNYTYPIEGELPGADSAEADIINAERLKRTMDKFLEVYPEQPPLMIETGFHTLEYNHGVMPAQTAGLVKDRATKAVALRAMCSFYQENYSNVIGILYFGYNLFNQEGNPPAEMDWALLYPAETENEAETAILEGEASIREDGDASGGQTAALGEEEGLWFQGCPPAQQLVLTYRSDCESTLSFWSGNKQKKEVYLEPSEEYRTIGVPLSLVEGYDLKIVCKLGEVLLDKVNFFTQMEAEYAACEQALAVKEHKEASNGLVVEQLEGKEHALAFHGTRGGDTLLITYAAREDTRLILERGIERYSLDLPASPELTELAAAISIAQGEDICLYEEGKGQLVLDAVTMSGPPAASRAPQKSEALPEGEEGEQEKSDGEDLNPKQPTEVGFDFKGMLAGGLAGIVIAGAFVGAALVYRKKMGQEETKGDDQ